MSERWRPSISTLLGEIIRKGSGVGYNRMMKTKARSQEIWHEVRTHAYLYASVYLCIKIEFTVLLLPLTCTHACQTSSILVQIFHYLSVKFHHLHTVERFSNLCISFQTSCRGVYLLVSARKFKSSNSDNSRNRTLRLFLNLPPSSNELGLQTSVCLSFYIIHDGSLFECSRWVLQFYSLWRLFCIQFLSTYRLIHFFYSFLIF